MVYRENLGPTGACPRCFEPLDSNANESGLRACTKCGGVFASVAASARIVRSLDRDMMSFDLDAQRGKRRAKDSGMRLRCPECGLEMERTRVESAACFVDACASHGTWFDALELTDVMRAYAARRRHIPAGVQPAGAPPVVLPSPPPEIPAKDPLGRLSQLLDGIVKDALGG